MNHLKTHQTNPTTAQYRPVQSNTSTAQYSQVQPIPELDPKPELFGQTRPEPDPKSKSPSRQSLVLTRSPFSFSCHPSHSSPENEHDRVVGIEVCGGSSRTTPTEAYLGQFEAQSKVQVNFRDG